MRPWSFPVELAPSAEPLFLQISRAIADDVRRGRLAAGALLPGSRTLAKTLGIHRNTVLAAYRELESQGWLVSERRATRIARDFPVRPPSAEPMARRLGFPLEPPDAPIGFRGHRPRAGELHFDAGLPDPRLFPAADLSRALRRALRPPLGTLGYGDARGFGDLRRGLAAMLRETRGLAVEADGIIVTGGSQGALDLLARVLFRPGDVVAVEDPGYPLAWSAFRAAGATLAPIPVDDDGLVVAKLAEVAQRRARLRAVYLTPHHQFPTTVSLSAARRVALLDLARARRLAVIEDDYDFEFAFERRPVLPLAAADEAGVVVYIGTLSKILTPALRLGWVAGPHPLVEALTTRVVDLGQQGDFVVQRAVAELLEDGLLGRHARKMRRVYQSRRDALAEGLAEAFPQARFTVPSGGMSLWVRWNEDVSAERWAARAHAFGVGFYPGGLFAFDGRPREPAARLGFSSLSEKELREALARLAASAR